MLISLMVAMDRRGLIGNDTGLPWHLPNDLRRFRTCTMGKPIIMGRRTFELIGRPLPGRLNIVLTRSSEWSAPGCQVARTLQEALGLAEDYLRPTGGEEVVIIGGAKVYTEALPRCERCYLTVVEGQFEGSVYFPVRELFQQSWHLVGAPELHPPDEKNRHPHSFYVLQRYADANRTSPLLEHGLSLLTGQRL